MPAFEIYKLNQMIGDISQKSSLIAAGEAEFDFNSLDDENLKPDMILDCRRDLFTREQIELLMDKSSSEDEQFMHWLISDITQNNLVVPAAIDAFRWRKRRDKSLRNPQLNQSSSHSEENTTDESNTNVPVSFPNPSLFFTEDQSIYENLYHNVVAEQIITSTPAGRKIAKVDELLDCIEKKIQKMKLVDHQIEENLLLAEEILACLKAKSKPNIRQKEITSLSYTSVSVPMNLLPSSAKVLKNGSNSKKIDKNSTVQLEDSSLHSIVRRIHSTGRTLDNIESRSKSREDLAGSSHLNRSLMQSQSARLPRKIYTNKDMSYDSSSTNKKDQLNKNQSKTHISIDNLVIPSSRLLRRFVGFGQSNSNHFMATTSTKVSTDQQRRLKTERDKKREPIVEKSRIPIMYKNASSSNPS